MATRISTANQVRWGCRAPSKKRWITAMERTLRPQSCSRSAPRPHRHTRTSGAGIAQAAVSPWMGGWSAHAAGNTCAAWHISWSSCIPIVLTQRPPCAYPHRCWAWDGYRRDPTR